MRVRDAEKERYAKGPGIWLKPNERVCTACKGHGSILLPGQRSNPKACTLCKATGKLSKATDRAALHRALDAALDAQGDTRWGSTTV